MMLDDHKISEFLCQTITTMEQPIPSGKTNIAIENDHL